MEATIGEWRIAVNQQDMFVENVVDCTKTSAFRIGQAVLFDDGARMSGVACTSRSSLWEQQMKSISSIIIAEPEFRETVSGMGR